MYSGLAHSTLPDATKVLVNSFFFSQLFSDLVRASENAFKYFEFEISFFRLIRNGFIILSLIIKVN
jgi:hypothetical protein